MNKRVLVYILILLILPFISKTVDAGYRKIVHGYFVSTPYSYVNAITLALFVSEKADSKDIRDDHHKILFLRSHAFIDSLGLLESKVQGSVNEKYNLFHLNFPIICNQNIHEKGLKYYLNKDNVPGQNAISIEEACKEMLPVLISNNRESYFSLYFASLAHGYKSILILFFVLFVAFYSFWKTLKNFTALNALLLLSSLLIISNSMLVAFASHSIMRYLFYNYFLGFLIVILLLRKLISKL